MIGGLSASYKRLFDHQASTGVAEPVQLDTEGNEIQLNNRYWIVEDGDEESLVYNDPVDIDNFMNKEQPTYVESVKALRKAHPRAILKRYIGNDIYREVEEP